MRIRLLETRTNQTTYLWRSWQRQGRLSGRTITGVLMVIIIKLMPICPYNISLTDDLVSIDEVEL
jgi:hypothetical protein